MCKLKTLLRQTLDRLWVPPQGQYLRGLAVYPIYRKASWNPFRRRDLNYQTLGQAVARQQALVSELPSAHVPELLVKNLGGSAVLGLDGDELVGGRQNRILNASLLLGSGETRVPVSCVERRRWREEGRPHFSGGERLPHGMRVSSHGHVDSNLRSQGGHASDQRAIWRDIDEGHRSHGVHSQTSSMHDWYEAQKNVLGAYEQAFAYPAQAVGMVVGIGGRLAGCDLFDQARTAEFYWPRLIRSCAAEAFQAAAEPPGQAPDSLLARVGSCQVEVFQSPGLGLDLRLRGEGVSGSALIYQDTVVHLSLFAAQEEV